MFFLAIIKANLKTVFSSKVEFWVNVLIAIVKQALFLLSWYYFFKTYHSINGWTYKELLLMHGILSFGVGIVEVFFCGVKDFSLSKLNIILLQPINPLLGMATSVGRPSSLGDIATSVYCLIVSGYILNPKLVIILPIAVLLVFSLNLYVSVIAGSLARELHSTTLLLASQPASGYHGWFKVLVFTAVPVGFISLLPVYFIQNNNFLSLWFMVGGAVLLLGITYFLFVMLIKNRVSNN